MGKILVIAEKPSVAKEIAHVVGAEKKVSPAKDARYGYYEGNSYFVSWCYGHLLTTYYPEDYDESLKSWDIKRLPFIPDHWKYKPTEFAEKQFNVLKKLLNSKEVSEVVCATDADREGELIFRLVYNESGSSKPVKRLWVSSMEDAAIRKGLKTMKGMREYDSLYHAASARQKADWIIGLNATRYFTTRYAEYPVVVNIGRVQTPTVNLIVQRQKEIENFEPQAYYVLTADTGTFKATLKKEKKQDADSIIAKCNGKSGFIESVKKEKKKTAPPKLYALTNLQQDANRLLGLSATTTLNTVQSLYEKKLLTYPRTDSQYLTSDMKESTEAIITGFLKKAGALGPTVKAAFGTEKPKIQAVINDKKVSGHHAIIPTTTALSENLTDLKEVERKIFDMVLYRFLAAVAPHYEYLRTEVILNVQDERFKAVGAQKLVGGWRDIADCLKDLIKSGKSSKKKEDDEEEEDLQELPELHEGDSFSRVKVTGEEKFTTPPPPYTEATLLEVMRNIGRKIEDKELKAIMSATDDNGNRRMLGTSATQGAIIDKIIDYGYVQKSGRKLEPTEKAYKLIAIVPEEIKSPEMTAEWEKALEDIREGKKTEEEFIRGISGFIKDVVTTGEGKFKNAPQAASSETRIEAPSLGPCPKCGSDVRDKVKLYGCTKKGCDFILWKTVAHKKLSETQAKKLLNKGRTDLLKGLKSAKGNSFDAFLVMDENGQTRFEFPNNIK